MSEKPVRKLSRLEGYDYSENGCYFVTICTKDRKCLLGRCVPVGCPPDHVGAAISRPNRIILSRIGRIVQKAIEDIPKHYSDVFVDKFIVMPNHVHLMLTLSQADSGRLIAAPTGGVSLSRIIGQMKRWCSAQAECPIWQKSFYDHIIRDDADYLTHWSYIDGNAQKWETDPLNIHITDKERETI